MALGFVGIWHCEKVTLEKGRKSLGTARAESFCEKESNHLLHISSAAHQSR
jgi:hypothetical protein